MFQLALESPLPTVRYLMIYSALMLLAKVTGRAADPKHVKQSDVDEMLRLEDPSIPLAPQPGHATKQETVFRKVRNVDRFKNLAARIVAAVP